MQVIEKATPADEVAIIPEQHVAGLCEAAKTRAALMFMILKHGQQYGYWSGDPANLADALWESHRLGGATVAIDLGPLACVLEWCDFAVAVRDGKLHITVNNTIVN